MNTRILSFTSLYVGLVILMGFRATAQKTVTLSTAQLSDKIKGGWAGQVIGCTFGGPTEFRFQGTMINDYQPIPWYDGYIKKSMMEIPSLYDDLYMDLTFVDVMDKHGIDAPVTAHAMAFAKADYRLWHANQAARYNILQGMMPPQSGHWLNNPHADDIDFQIESDFAGLMSPGMPNTAIAIGDPIGHIMNYGDGWYGGVYVSAMYSLAFISTDMPTVVTEALKAIPAQSTFYKCIRDVIDWHKQYPNDWKQTWLEVQKKWSDDIGCPDGVFHAYNIDAKLNAAYIVIGLLYGNGDFTKTMEISTRCGQDSDCNPSSAGGILGVMLGYNRLPAYWKMGLKEAETIPFKFTTISLEDAYRLGVKQARQVIAKNGGTVTDNQVIIKTQTPTPVRLEQSFAGHFPTERRALQEDVGDTYTCSFDGNGFVLYGKSVAVKDPDPKDPYVLEADLYVDGAKVETLKLPVAFTPRRLEIAWKYQLPMKRHEVKLKITNPNPAYVIRITNLITYADKPYTYKP